MVLVKPDDLLVKYFDHECSLEEQSSVISWINESQENYRYYLTLKETWLLTHNYDMSFQPDTNRAWKNVLSRIEKAEFENIKSSRIYYRAAAIFFIAVSLYLGYTLFFSAPVNNNIEFSNKYENIQNIDLPDGSKVWLTKNSKISYSRNFDGATRNINLYGEAFFEVTKNLDKPFIVTGNRTIVKVLGTSFIYRSFDNEPDDKLTVNSGKVAFFEKSNVQNKIDVDYGYEAKFNRETRLLEKIVKDDKSYFAFKTGRLIFENERFEDIFSKVSKYYHRNYYISDPKLNEVRLTIAFNNQSIEDAIKLLETVMDRKITDSSMTMVIY
jgi:transmembrane sensor